MLVRRLLPLLVALVAAGVLPTSAATAGSSKCVALVVDASSFGAGVTSSCVTAASDASSSDVLVKSGHRVTFDPRYGDDFVCAIDGRPAGGCHATDSTHYWAYYHRAPGSSAWQISQEGAGTYRPANASTDGWVYDDGASQAPHPADVPYRSICKTAASPSPSPTATPTRTHSTTRPSPAASSPHARRAAGPTGPTPAARRHAATPMPTPTTTTSAPSPASSSAAPSTSSPAATAAVEPHPAKRSGFPLALVVGLAAAAGLGGLATVRLRRGGG